MELASADEPPIHSEPYQACPSAREFEEHEMDGMLEMDVIKHRNKTIGSHHVHTQERRNTLIFCELPQSERSNYLGLPAHPEYEWIHWICWWFQDFLEPGLWYRLRASAILLGRLKQNCFCLSTSTAPFYSNYIQPRTYPGRSNSRWALYCPPLGALCIGLFQWYYHIM